jgi:hypothetical protein
VSDTIAVLTGRTFDGTHFEGADSVRIVSRLVGPFCTPWLEGLTNFWPGDGTGADIAGGLSAVFHEDATTGPGLVDKAFILDGDGDFVDVPDDVALNIGTGDFTVALWVYFNDTAGEQILAEKWIQRFPNAADELGSEGWTLTKLEGNKLLLAMSTVSSDEVDVVSHQLGIPSRTWIHFAATRKDGTITLFMNGRPVAGGSSPLNLDSTASLKFGHRGNPVDIPGSQDGGGMYLNGRIDEVQFSSWRAFLPEEISAIFAAGSAGVCKY